MSSGRPVRLALSAAALALSASTALADPFALVASVKGRVDVIRASGGEPVRASFGRPLERGDRISVAEGGAATIYFSDGNVIELAEKSSVTVGGKVAGRAAVGPAALGGGVYAQVSRAVTTGSRETGLVAMSTMRSGDAARALAIAPRNSDVLADRPGFAWEPVEGAARYRLSVSGADGALWEREVEASHGTSIAYPADAPALARDAEYLWTLAALGERGTLRSDEASFHVVGAEAAATIRSDVLHLTESAGGPGHTATEFLAGSYLLGRGLFVEAVERFTALGRLAPDSPAPHEALGNTYKAMGLMDRAAAEYQKALELTRTP